MESRKNLIDILKPLRGHAGKLRTHGLDDATLLELAKRFPELTAAAEAATGGCLLRPNAAM